VLKEDRRIRKTKKALREGLAELLMEKNIQSITVRELTDRADVHRSTFYANFKDVYDLHKHVEDVVIQEIKDIISIEYHLDTKAFFSALFLYINDNKKISRLFFGENASGNFFNQISSLFVDSCMDCWRKEFNLKVLPSELRIYAQFILSGSLGVVREWVEGGFEMPMEALMVIFIDIDKGFRQRLKSKFCL